MGTVAVAVVIGALLAVSVALFQPHVARILAAGREEPRAFELEEADEPDDGPPDLAGVRVPRSPKPSSDASGAALERPGDSEAA